MAQSRERLLTRRKANVIEADIQALEAQLQEEELRLVSAGSWAYCCFFVRLASYKA